LGIARHYVPERFFRFVSFQCRRVGES
jgi:hypothetical protein